MWEGKGNADLKLNGQTIVPGAQQLVKIEIAKLPTGTVIDLPVHVFNASKKGPVVLLQAGLHGDEINGVEVLRKLLVDKKIKLKRGALIVVPILNLFGFIHFSRDVPDGKDVNRSFPGSNKGSLASRIAYTYAQEVLPLADIAIDLHTGGGQRYNYPQIRYTAEDLGGKTLAEVFNAPFNFPSSLIRGSFRNEAFKLGKTVLVYEAGESMRFSSEAMRIAKVGILNVLNYLQMIKTNDEPLKTKSIALTKRRWIRAPRAGMFLSEIANGSKIEKGQPLGYITDTNDQKIKRIKAPYDGYVFCINNQAVVNQGDALYHIGH